MTGPGEYAPVVGVGTSMYKGGERNEGYNVWELWGRGAEQERSNGSSIDEVSSSLSDSSCRVKVGPLDPPDPAWGLWGRGAEQERSNGSSSNDVSSSLSDSGCRRKVGVKVGHLDPCNPAWSAAHDDGPGSSESAPSSSSVSIGSESTETVR